MCYTKRLPVLVALELFLTGVFPAVKIILKIHLNNKGSKSKTWLYIYLSAKTPLHLQELIIHTTPTCFIIKNNPDSWSTAFLQFCDLLKPH